jgi:5-methylcytosine-specific restriction endonuclease McrA
MKTLHCTTCGLQLDIVIYRIEESVYCSLTCRDARFVGDHAKYIKQIRQVELTCAHCSAVFYREPSRAKYGRGKHCSKDCQYAARRAQPKAVTTRSCIGCGATFQVQTCKIGARGCGKYCNRACRDEHRTGVNHPQYLNGQAQERRGPNWHAQRRKALKRDNSTCQHCHNPGCHVHHIKPFRHYGLDRYKEANRLSNLIVLCDKCHRTEEVKIQRTERESTPMLAT